MKTAWEEFSQAIIKENKNVILITHSGVMGVICSIVEGKSFSSKIGMGKIEHATLMPLMYDGTWAIMEE